MKKSYIALFSFSVFSTVIYAQENSQIELPDVTTVVNAESLKAEKDSLPDFADVLAPSAGSGAVTVQLPDVDGQSQTADVVVENKQSDKTVYAEGQFGAGFPHYFTGDFAVYSIALNNPFDLRFSHKTASGYGEKTLSEGYSNKNTSVKIKKELDYKNAVYNFSGSYDSINLGLQNKSPLISGINNDKISGYADARWTLPKGFDIGVSLDGNIYNRYCDVTVTDSSLPAWILSSSSTSIKPGFSGSWKGRGFTIDLTGSFYLDFSHLEKEKVSNQGNFGLGFDWENKYVKIYTKGDVVFGSLTGEQKVLLPFTAGFNANIPVSFANRKISLTAEGGLEVLENSIWDLEGKNHYTAFNFVPDDSAAWYGSFKMDFPVKTSFSSSANIEFKKTANNNGFYLADYSEPAYGLYGYEKKNQTYLSTDFTCSYHYKILSVSGGWHSNWIDIPGMETPVSLLVELTVQSESSKWGASVTGKIGLGKAGDIPVINLNGFVKISNAARLILSAEDTLKLVSGSLRNYNGQYSSTGGTAAIMLKFNF